MRRSISVLTGAMLVLIIVILSIMAFNNGVMARSQALLASNFQMDCTSTENVDGAVSINCSGIIPVDATSTPIPPTSTQTATSTPIPPTFTPTSTPVPPTATATAISPIPTPTNVSPLPTPTNVSPIPTPTAISPIPTPTPGLRGRARVESGTILADNGYGLHGESVTLNDAGITKLQDAAFWDRLAQAHINTLRLVVQVDSSACVGGCVPDLTYPVIEGTLHDTRARGMYLIIAYADTAPVLNETIAASFWNETATRYGYYPDIIFDLTNPPCVGYPACYLPEDMAKVETLYNTVLSVAPASVMILWSFSYGEGNMLGVVSQLPALNDGGTAVGFSSTYTRNFVDINALKDAGYPVFDNEVAGCGTWSFCEAKARGNYVRNISWAFAGATDFITTETPPWGIDPGVILQ